MSHLADVYEWVVAERREYADTKWTPPDAAKAHRDCVIGEGPTTWHDWAGNYIKRAAMFGVDTPQGRQALGKAIVTLIHVLATAVEEYGPMPAPGVPSGVIEEWTADRGDEPAELVTLERPLVVDGALCLGEWETVTGRWIDGEGWA